MTAPDRGATYQIALASTGSSTHDTWDPAAKAGVRLITDPPAFSAGAALHAPLRSLLSTKGGGDHKISDASPQSSNLRIGSQLPFHIVTAGSEDDAGGAAGLEPGETF